MALLGRTGTWCARPPPPNYARRQRQYAHSKAIQSGVTRPAHSPHMASTLSAPGHNMASTWSAHCQHLVRTWPAHGQQTLGRHVRVGVALTHNFFFVSPFSIAMADPGLVRPSLSKNITANMHANTQNSSLYVRYIHNTCKPSQRTTT